MGRRPNTAEPDQTPQNAASDQVHHCLLTVLKDFSLTVKAATLIFISVRGSAISSAKEGKSGFIYNLAKLWAAQT